MQGGQNGRSRYVRIGHTWHVSGWVDTWIICVFKYHCVISMIKFALVAFETKAFFIIVTATLLFDWGGGDCRWGVSIVVFVISRRRSSGCIASWRWSGAYSSRWKRSRARPSARKGRSASTAWSSSVRWSGSGSMTSSVAWRSSPPGWTQFSFFGASSSPSILLKINNYLSGFSKVSRL